MNTVIDNMEGLVAEAHKNKGWQWVQHEPLWVTWSLNKFGMNSIVERCPTSQVLPSDLYTRYSACLSP